MHLLNNNPSFEVKWHSLLQAPLIIYFSKLNLNKKLIQIYKAVQMPGAFEM